jgi:hypothetical protein
MTTYNQIFEKKYKVKPNPINIKAKKLQGCPQKKRNMY